MSRSRSAASSVRPAGIARPRSRIGAPTAPTRLCPITRSGQTGARPPASARARMSDDSAGHLPRPRRASAPAAVVVVAEGELDLVGAPAPRSRRSPATGDRPGRSSTSAASASWTPRACAPCSRRVRRCLDAGRRSRIARPSERGAPGAGAGRPRPREFEVVERARQLIVPAAASADHDRAEHHPVDRRRPASSGSPGSAAGTRSRRSRRRTRRSSRRASAPTPTSLVAGDRSRAARRGRSARSAGIDSRNEKRAAASRLSPRKRPAVIVAPERETPGISASAWARPTQIASRVPTSLDVARRAAPTRVGRQQDEAEHDQRRCRSGRGCAPRSRSGRWKARPKIADRDRRDDDVPAHARVELAAQLRPAQAERARCARCAPGRARSR